MENSSNSEEDIKNLKSEIKMTEVNLLINEINNKLESLSTIILMNSFLIKEVSCYLIKD